MIQELQAIHTEELAEYRAWKAQQQDLNAQMSAKVAAATADRAAEKAGKKKK
jgi:ABC-type cobalamin transport system ATPase subunit